MKYVETPSLPSRKPGGGAEDQLQKQNLRRCGN